MPALIRASNKQSNLKQLAKRAIGVRAAVNNEAEAKEKEELRDADSAIVQLIVKSHALNIKQVLDLLWLVNDFHFELLAATPEQISKDPQLQLKQEFAVHVLSFIWTNYERQLIRAYKRFEHASSREIWNYLLTLSHFNPALAVNFLKKVSTKPLFENPSLRQSIGESISHVLIEPITMGTTPQTPAGVATPEYPTTPQFPAAAQMPEQTLFSQQQDHFVELALKYDSGFAKNALKWFPAIQSQQQVIAPTNKSATSSNSIDFNKVSNKGVSTFLRKVSSPTTFFRNLAFKVFGAKFFDRYNLAYPASETLTAAAQQSVKVTKKAVEAKKVKEVKQPLVAAVSTTDNKPKRSIFRSKFEQVLDRLTRSKNFPETVWKGVSATMDSQYNNIEGDSIEEPSSLQKAAMGTVELVQSLNSKSIAQAFVFVPVVIKELDTRAVHQEIVKEVVNKSDVLDETFELDSSIVHSEIPEVLNISVINPNESFANPFDQTASGFDSTISEQIELDETTSGFDSTKSGNVFDNTVEGEPLDSTVDFEERKKAGSTGSNSSGPNIDAMLEDIELDDSMNFLAQGEIEFNGQKINVLGKIPQAKCTTEGLRELYDLINYQPSSKPSVSRVEELTASPLSPVKNEKLQKNNNTSSQNLSLGSPFKAKATFFASSGANKENQDALQLDISLDASLDKSVEMQAFQSIDTSLDASI